MWASLLVWWLRICLEMQGTPVQSLVWEDSTCPGATKPVHPNYWASALPPTCYNYWASVLQLLKPMSSRACAPKPEKPLQWEAHALLLESSPQLRKATFTARPTTAPPKIKNFKFIFFKKDTMQIPIWRFRGGSPNFSLDRITLGPWLSFLLAYCFLHIRLTGALISASVTAWPQSSVLEFSIRESPFSRALVPREAWKC